MSYADDLTFLRETCDRHAADLDALLPAIGDSPRGTALVEVVRQALDGLKAAVAGLAAEFGKAGDDKDREAVVEKARGFSYNLRLLHMALPWIESARRLGVSQGELLLFDEMGEAILGTPVDVVPTPEATYMYAARPRPFRSAFRAIKHPYPSVAPPVIVYYPTAERQSLFMHLCMAHELGHGGVLERDLLRAVEKVSTAQSSDVTARLAEAGLILHRDTALDKTLAQARARVAFRDWLEEALCDALALSYLGPSYLLTSVAFGLQFSGRAPSESHPSQSFRTSLLLDQMDEVGWLAEFEDALPNMANWIKSIASQTSTPNGDAYLLKVEETIRLLAGSVRAVASLSGHAFLPTNFKDGDELAELMEARILPAQLLSGQPADRRSIIYAGWLHGFMEHGDNPASLVAITSDRSFQAFLTKAIEMSAILEKWEKV